MTVTADTTGGDGRLPATSQGTHEGAFTALDWTLLLSCAAIWGSSFLFMEVALRSMTPGLITFGRVAFGALALGLLPAARSPVARADWGRLALLGLTWMALPFTLFPVAQQWIDSSMAGMLNATMPVLTAVVTLLLARRPPGRAQAIGLAVGLAGTFVIGWSGLDGAGSGLGVVLVVLAVCGYAISVNMAVPLQQRYGSLPVLVRIQGVAVLLTAPAGLAGIGRSSFELRGFLSVVALGMLGTGLAFVAMASLIGRVGATRGSISTYLVPVVSVSLGALVLGERIPASALVGTALVLTGAFLVTRAERIG